MKKTPVVLVCAEAPTLSALIAAQHAIAAPASAMGEFMYMPGGVQTINCKQITPKGNKPITAQVEVNKAGAAALQKQLEAVSARSAHKPFFDFNHEDREASFWPTAFMWRDQPAPGIYASGEWSEAGRQAIEGKTFRAFSGKFYVDDETATPAHIVCNPEADLNFGGLVNKPAFKNNLPLWAKESETPAPESKKELIKQMKKTLAELQAKLATVETEITGLKAAKTAGSKEFNDSALEAKETQLSLIKSEMRVAELEARETAQREKDADNAIKAAVTRGAITAKDTKSQEHWKKLLVSDPSNLVLLEAMEGKAVLTEGRLTEGRTLIEAKEGPKRVMQAYAALVAKNSGIQVSKGAASAFETKGQIAREMASIYAREIQPNLNMIMDMPLIAADFTDANLGILSGTLVAQRTLELFRYQFPFLRDVYTDFSDMPAQFNQVETTRIIVNPALVTYDATLDATGRPKGWTVAVPAKSTDVPIKLDEHVGVPIVFDSNQLASTARRLFDEQAPAASYVLSKRFVDKLYALITPANFNAYAAIVAGKVPVAYPYFAVGLADVSRGTLSKVSGIMNQNEVPINDRVALFNSAYYGQLSTDPSLVNFFAGQRAPEIVTDNQLPKLSTFIPREAPNLPGTNNLAGFAMQKSALVAKSRLSNDYTQALPGASYGSVTTVTDPQTGLSVMLVQYVNHTGGYAEWRIQAMLGAAVGDNRAGLCFTTQ